LYWVWKKDVAAARSRRKREANAYVG